jgi:TonB family protein
MKGEHKNIIYTAKDIEQYLSGRMSPGQMHAMEKAALDDPLLADAIEGYAAFKENDWSAELSLLHKQLAEKGNVAKVIPLHRKKNNWRRIAAAVLFIGAGATLTYIFTNNNEANKDASPEIAQAVPVQDSLATAAATAPVSVTESLNPTATETKEELVVNGPVAKQSTPEGNVSPLITPAIPEPLGAAEKNSGAIVADNMRIPPLPPPPVNNVPINNAQLSEVASNSPAGADDDSRKNFAARSNTNAKKNAVLNNYFTAQVVAPDNTPLPFTNISIKKDNFGTYADAKGMVRLISTDSVLHVEVKSVGYQPRVYALRNNQAQTKIVLQEDENALQDRVVIGNSKPSGNQRARRASLLMDSARNVEPADGWENYNTYVANNFEIPEDMLKREIRGEVELSFEVKANGTITNLKVNKSMGTEYDEAAKRLILEGPQWKVKNGKKKSVSVKVQF